MNAAMIMIKGSKGLGQPLRHGVIPIVGRLDESPEDKVQLFPVDAQTIQLFDPAIPPGGDDGGTHGGRGDAEALGLTRGLSPP
jgi:hypothetical protein